MLELYQSYADVDDMMILCENLIKNLAVKFNITNVDFMNQTIDLNKKFTKVSMNDLMINELGCDILSISDEDLFKICKKHNLDDSTFNFGQLFKLFSSLIEPKLIQPTFVYDYPKSISPLAKVHRENDKLAERFELFIAGMEFANAFSELNDPIDQKDFKIS